MTRGCSNFNGAFEATLNDENVQDLTVLNLYVVIVPMARAAIEKGLHSTRLSHAQSIKYDGSFCDFLRRDGDV